MEVVHFKAVWMPTIEMFGLKFQIIEGGSPAYWNIEAGYFLKMIEQAERQLVVLDGQNRQNKSYFHFEFIDKLGNDVEINLEKTDKDVFRQMTEYLRKVYDSWKTSYG